MRRKWSVFVVFLAGFLLQGQSVHVAAQQDHLAGLFAARQRKHAALAAVLRGVAHLFSLLTKKKEGDCNETAKR